MADREVIVYPEISGKNFYILQVQIKKLIHFLHTGLAPQNCTIINSTLVPLQH